MRFRPLLKPSQWAELTGIPVDEEYLIRHYTLSGTDIDRILAKRGHHNRLGFAVQLCLMRCPGRLLMQDETPPSALLSFVANQIGVSPATIAAYAQRDNTRREHAAELQSWLGLRTATRAVVGLSPSLHLPKRRECGQTGRSRGRSIAAVRCTT